MTSCQLTLKGKVIIDQWLTSVQSLQSRLTELERTRMETIIDDMSRAPAYDHHSQSMFNPLDNNDVTFVDFYRRSRKVKTLKRLI